MIRAMSTWHPTPRQAHILAAVRANPGISGKAVANWKKNDYDIVLDLVRRGLLMRFRQRLFVPGQLIPVEVWMRLFPGRTRKRFSNALPANAVLTEEDIDRVLAIMSLPMKQAAVDAIERQFSSSDSPAPTR
jgi:hypothetical protein